MAETKFTIEGFKRHLTTLPKPGEVVKGILGTGEIKEILVFIGVNSDSFEDENGVQFVLVKGYDVLFDNNMVMTIDKLIVPWIPEEGEPVAVWKDEFVVIQPYRPMQSTTYDYICKIPDNWHKLPNYLKMSKNDYWIPGIKDGTIEFLS